MFTIIQEPLHAILKNPKYVIPSLETILEVNSNVERGSTSVALPPFDDEPLQKFQKQEILAKYDENVP